MTATEPRSTAVMVKHYIGVGEDKHEEFPSL